MKSSVKKGRREGRRRRRRNAKPIKIKSEDTKGKESRENQRKNKEQARAACLQRKKKQNAEEKKGGRSPNVSCNDSNNFLTTACAVSFRVVFSLVHNDLSRHER